MTTTCEDALTLAGASERVFAPGLFANQVLLVTGGGTGIGRCICLQAARLGARVALVGRREEPLRSTAQELQSVSTHGDGDGVMWRSCDIRDSEAVQGVVRDVMDAWGRIDVLVNNAGGQYPTPAQHCTPKGFNAVVRNNLIGTWNMVYWVANLAMLEQESGGRIVNVIAVVDRGFPGMVHTGAARAGVDNLTKTCAVEWARRGIAVNAVAPGFIESSGTQRYAESFRRSAIRATPTGRAGTPTETAWLVLYLASRLAAGFITGQTFTIDGGQTVGNPMWLYPEDDNDGDTSTTTMKAKL